MPSSDEAGILQLQNHAIFLPSIKHPPMSPSRWAKIFVPFDALDGFDERIKAKEEIYVERKALDGGKYTKISGTVLRIEMDVIRLRTEDGEKSIAFSDIKEIV